MKQHKIRMCVALLLVGAMLNGYQLPQAMCISTVMPPLCLNSTLCQILLKMMKAYILG